MKELSNITLTRMQKKHHKYKFARAISKYGIGDFDWTILLNNVLLEKLDLEEVSAIYIYDTYYSGYNSTLGGESPMRGRKHTKESRIKIGTNRIYKSGSEHPSYGTKSPWLSERNKLKLYACPRGKDSRLSKTYIVVSPNGTEVVVKGITQFCKENNLDQGNMCRVARGEQIQHKGYKCSEIKE